jgi:hypothetical protein
MPKLVLEHSNDNVIDIFTRKPLSDLSNNRIIRVAAELDGLEILYSNSENPDKLFSVKVLAWGLKVSGEVVGLVPWLDKLVACDEINDPLNGQWQGYYDQGVDQLFLTLHFTRSSNLRPLLIIMIINVTLMKKSSKRFLIASAPMQFYRRIASIALH